MHAKPSQQGDYPGVVVINFGDFDDVPGLEIISDGVSTTTLGSIAIGRQGRFLLWGFTADPEGLTPVGRELFLSSVRYLFRKRASKTIPFACHTRHYLKFRCDSVLETIREKSPRAEDIRKAFEEILKPAARAEVQKLKPEEYGRWLEENFAYIVGDPSSASRHKEVYDVDADARALRTPNNKLESLKTWVGLLNGDEGARARRCLDRYVGDVEGGWAAWLEKNAARILFCDSAGFKFIEDPTRDEK